MPDVPGNRYRIDYLVKNRYLTELRLYASCKGFRARYYGDQGRDNYPVLDRIEPTLPGRFDLAYRRMSFFAADFEFVFNPLLAGERMDVDHGDEVTRSVTLSLAINSGAEADVLVDEEVVISIQPTTPVIDPIDCRAAPPEATNTTDSAHYWEANMLTGETEQTGCCLGANGEWLHSYTYEEMKVDGSGFYYIRIRYKHQDSQYHNLYRSEPCVKLFRHIHPATDVPDAPSPTTASDPDAATG